MPTIKCVVVGDGGVGKTCLLYTYINEHFPADDAFKTAHESCKGTVIIGGEQYTLSLLDTSGQEHTDRLRISVSYNEADAFLVCFNVVAPASLDSVKNMWVPEISKECPNKPFLLVGTKVDLRDDTSTINELQEHQKQPITQEQGVKLARKLRAVKYVECSAITQHGLDNVFHGAIRAVLEARKKKKGCILS